MTLPVVLRRRWLLPGVLGVVVLALHVAVLSRWTPGVPDDAARSAPVAAMQVRSVALAPVMTVAAPPPAAAAPPRARLAHALPVAALSSPARPASTPSAETLLLERPSPVAVAMRATEPAPAATAAPNGIEVPLYATRLPPSGRWRYRLQRGAANGEAELQWSRPPEGRYELRLEGRAAGVTLLEWFSQGAIDGAGIAPERFAVRRRGRDSQAANFQREAGKITFSGPTHEVPLPAGAQDRLSWMVQLPAIVDAAPERFGAGTRILLFVAGARGDADLWAFEVQGIELLGDVPALKLVREPRRLYDTRAEVWLDAGDHHMPVRAVQTPAGGGVALTLQRE